MTDPEDTRDFDALPSFAPVGQRPKPPPKALLEPPPRPVPAPKRASATPPPRPRRRPRRSRAALGVFAVAACLVIGFICGRLIGPYAARPPAATEAAIPLSGAGSGAVAPATAGAGGGPTASRVVIHYADSDAGRQAAVTLAEELSRAGYGMIEIRSQTTAVAGNRIRYFAASERDAAAALDRIAERVLRRLGHASPQLQDFTDFSPKPPDGTLEIWLGAG